jgi:polygalacturonase
MRHTSHRSITLLLAVATSWNAVGAQDRRSVVEPTVPPACATVPAELEPVADSTLGEGDERRLDTDRIQSAIDHCAAGHSVLLAASGSRRAFLSGPLQLRQGVTLVVGPRAILFGSRDPRLFDLPGERRCGTVDARGHGCLPLIGAEGVAHAGVMGPGTIDGRGWATLLGRDVSWWDLAQRAKVEKRYQSCPRIMQLTRADDFTLYRLTLRNSPNFHVMYERGTGFTAWGVVIHTPDPRARNTDGIDPSAASDVTITHSFINTGDDDVAIKAGSAGAATHITVSHNHFYRGHGVSIGSETNGGASAIRVFGLSIDGADNGLRIKSNASRGGLVHDVEYRDVCIRRTKNPIEMDTHYSASAETTGTLIPEFRDIRLQNVRVLDGGRVILEGHDAARPLRMSWNGVWFDTPAAMKVSASHVELTRGPGPVNLSVTGDDVHVLGTPGEAPAAECTDNFAPMPRSAATAAVRSSGLASIVDARFTGADGALVKGMATFRTVGGALDGLPQNGVGRAVILVRNGRYHEKLTVDRPYVTLRGNAAKSDADATKVRNAQAVALMLDMDADRSTFVNVRITGFQDTLFPNAGRSHFAKCVVSGTVDFIFGAGRAVFDDCDIVSRDRGNATNNGYLTAPSTPADSPYGFVFVHSRLKKERQAMAPASVALGRPWHPYAKQGVSSSAVQSPSRRVLSAAEAARYAPSAVLDGWIPSR